MAELVDALGLGSSSRKGNGGSSPSSCTKSKRLSRAATETSLLKAVISHDQTNGLGRVDITVPSKIVLQLYRHALATQKRVASPIGFYQTHAPLPYVDAYYKEHIITHLKEFILKYCVLSFLYRTLRTKKIVLIGEPRLANINLSLEADAQYTFTFTPAQTNLIHEWRYLPFKAPQRKKYKDIDKQATALMTEETENKKKYTSPEIMPGDWVFFTVILLNQHDLPIVPNWSDAFWIQISDEETSQPFRELFAEKKKGDRFISTSQCLHDFFGSQLDTPYRFGVTIKEVIPYAYVCLDLFKEHFRLKTNNKLHQKIVEVFSFKNDMSLRRLLVEEALALLRRIYPAEIPQAAILRQKQLLHEQLQINPDYAVYKSQPDFNERVHQLAYKQIQERLLLSALAVHENVSIEDQDVYRYLNLTKRARTKEFIYLLHPSIRANEEEFPISHESLKYTCLHEKTLNYILYCLTKN